MKKYFFLSLLSFLVFIALIAFMKHYLGPQIMDWSEWLYQRFGFVFLLVLLFISDIFFSPLPPNLLLLIIVETKLQQSWFLWVSLTGISSCFGGHGSFFLARSKMKKLLRLLIRYVPRKVKRLIAQYGALGVAVAAITPLPYSASCYVAGSMRVSYPKFFVASLFRILRMYLYYGAIQLGFGLA